MTDPPAASATSSDSDLIAAVRDGDAGAYGILYERHSARAQRLARQIVPEQADADDVVSETFTKVLAAIKGGSGPAEAFLPYLLTAVRRVAFDHVKVQRAQIPTDEAGLGNQGEPSGDPAEASLERALIAGAFAELPERWSAVLWLTEVEQARPAEVALQLGISPNSVAALRYRAREGLRQAYLQMHVSQARTECQPVASLLGGYVRGALSRRDAKRADEHLATCEDCQAARAELDAINGTMRGVLAPVLLGGAATGYLAPGGHAAATGLVQAASRTLQRIPWHRAGTQAAAAVAVAGIAVTVTLAGPHHASPNTTGPLGLAPPASGGNARSGGGPGASGDPGPGRHRASPTPAPTGSASRSPRPTPSGSVSGTPAPSPTSPHPGPTGPSAGAKLSVGVSVSGLLNLGVIDVVSVNVSDPGTAATGGLTVNLGLPAGITLLGLGSGSAGWTCSGASCTHAAIGAGASATVSFRVLVASLAGCGNPVTATAISGSLSATGRSAKQVQCG
ncbi:MAG TPA: sigma-70 family RNA polymerase sigma factor [Streptosporangiaceae bacterium]